MAGLQRVCSLQVSLSNESIATLAAYNGSNAADRLALKQLNVQLLDNFGNHTAARTQADCQVRLQAASAKRLASYGMGLADNAQSVARMQVVLSWQEGGESASLGCELPHLVTSAGAEPVKALDMSGAVSFGDILIAEGSGKVPLDASNGTGTPAAVNLCVKVQVFGVQFEADASEAGGDGWSTVWEKELLFTDDAQHMTRIAEYTQAQRKHALQAQVRLCEP
jgi:hypothetical protein